MAFLEEVIALVLKELLKEQDGLPAGSLLCEFPRRISLLEEVLVVGEVSETEALQLDESWSAFVEVLRRMTEEPIDIAEINSLKEMCSEEFRTLLRVVQLEELPNGYPRRVTSLGGGHKGHHFTNFLDGRMKAPPQEDKTRRITKS